MLQQTQVNRVLPYYRSFLRRFPSVRALAEASLADILRAWQGLGYNRRARLLHEAAKIIVREHGGRLPQTVEELEKLPGVGPYTARAVAAFAYNLDTLFVETNIRTAVIRHFFPKKQKIRDADILIVLARVLPKGRSREWYGALMDYGAHLKRTGIKLNDRSTTYAHQSVFKGSGREARGAILRELSSGMATEARLCGLLGEKRVNQLQTALSALLKEGMVERKGRTYRLKS